MPIRSIDIEKRDKPSFSQKKNAYSSFFFLNNLEEIKNASSFLLKQLDYMYSLSISMKRWLTRIVRSNC